MSELDRDQVNTYQITLPVNDAGFAEIMFLGDIHFGNPNMGDTHLQRYLKIVKENPHIRLILMGDYFEASDFTADYRMISTNEKRFREQITEMVQYFAPVNDQVIVALWGNHDERVLRIRAVKEVLDAIGIKNYLKYILHENLNKDIIVGPPQEGVTLFLKVGKQTYTVYATHGGTTARYRAFIQIERMLDINTADILCHGHNHVLDYRFYRKFVPALIDGQPVRKIVEQLGCLTGCFLRYGGYAEARSYPMNRMGAPLLKLYKDLKFVEPSLPHQRMDLHGYFTHAYGKTPLAPRISVPKFTKPTKPSNLGRKWEET